MPVAQSEQGRAHGLAGLSSTSPPLTAQVLHPSPDNMPSIQIQRFPYGHQNHVQVKEATAAGALQLTNGSSFFQSLTPLMPYSIFSIKKKIIRTMKQLFLPPKQLRVCKGLLEIQRLHETCSNLLWKGNNYFYQRHKLFKTIWITTKSLYSSILWSAKSPRRHTHTVLSTTFMQNTGK